jgi:hypothetical protein
MSRQFGVEEDKRRNAEIKDKPKACPFNFLKKFIPPPSARN